MNVTRPAVFSITTAGLSGSSIAMMGFSPTAALAEVRTFSLRQRPKHGTRVRTARFLRRVDRSKRRQVQERTF